MHRYQKAKKYFIPPSLFLSLSLFLCVPSLAVCSSFMSFMVLLSFLSQCSMAALVFWGSWTSVPEATSPSISSRAPSPLLPFSLLLTSTYRSTKGQKYTTIKVCKIFKQVQFERFFFPLHKLIQFKSSKIRISK